MSHALPDGWRWVELGSVAVQRSSKFDPQANGETVPYVALEHLEPYVNRVGQYAASVDATSLKSRFFAGDILFGKLRPYLRKVARTHFDGVCSTDILVFFNTDQIDGDYLLYVAESDSFIEYAVSTSAGTKMPRTSWEQLEDYSFPLPPLNEQRRIAAVLRDADASITRVEEAICAAQEVKRGVMRRVFTYGMGGEDTPTQHTPIGEIPAGWEIVKLENCVRSPITYGIVQAGPHFENGIPYIKTGDMTGGKLELSQLQRTAPEIAASYSRSSVQAGEIVFALRGNVGTVLEVPSELEGANLTQGTARIAPSLRINNVYLLWALQSNCVRDEINRNTKGTTFVEITLARLRELLIPLPPREEQREIAALLQSHDTAIRAMQAEAARLRELKRGLMQGLLSGEIRTSP